MKAQEFLRELNVKVRNGMMKKEDAIKLAVQAVSEVTQKEPEKPAPPAPAPKKEPVKPIKHAGITPVDAKNKIMALLGELDQTFAHAWTDFQEKITAIVRETEGGVIPVGDYNLGITKGGHQAMPWHSKDVTVKFSISAADQTTLSCLFTTKREWIITDVQGLPMAEQPKIMASVEPTCHIPLRKDVLALTEEIMENCESELAWRKFKVPVNALFSAKKDAESVNDPRLQQALAATPFENLTAKDQWASWATDAQVKILGGDYLDTEGEPAAGADMNWWQVKLNGKEIDQVPYTKDCDEEYVKKSLIEHDGYDAGIEVKLLKK